MPELPEVETIRRQLEPRIVGGRVGALEVLDPRWTAPQAPEDVERRCVGGRIAAVERRGKYLLLRLDNGRTLVMHLRMTGNLVLCETPAAGAAAGEPHIGEDPAAAANARYVRARIVLDDGRELWFTDPRRFGHAIVLDDGELEGHFSSRLGIEPLSPDLTAESIGRLASGRRAPLKSFLLAQDAIAGIGNIYADEALHRAALHPLSPADSMRAEHLEALRAGIVAALEAGLRHGGASIDDYRDARGEQGSMQDEFLVHAREGEECPRCGGQIRRIVVSGRSTYFCPACQRRLRRRPRRRRARMASAR